MTDGFVATPAHADQLPPLCSVRVGVCVAQCQLRRVLQVAHMMHYYRRCINSARFASLALVFIGLQDLPPFFPPFGGIVECVMLHRSAPPRLSLYICFIKPKTDKTDNFAILGNVYNLSIFEFGHKKARHVLCRVVTVLYCSALIVLFGRSLRCQCVPGGHVAAVRDDPITDSALDVRV